jgi:hypothetical protein
VQVRHGARVAAIAVCLAVALPRPSAAIDVGDTSTLNSLMRFFTDTDHITVRSVTNDYSMPIRTDMQLALHWNNERVTIPAVKAPPGSQAAIDAITTASRPISGNAYQDYIKNRNELEGEVTRGHSAVDFYYSVETDYIAHQIGARVDRDYHDQMINVSLGTSVGWDEIKPLADSDTNTGASTKTTLHWNAVATEILTPTTLLRYGLEYNVVEGLQHNPYRNVYAGGTHVPEKHPDHRERRDGFLKLNQYLASRASVKLNYRLYNDDWGITSHELETDLNQYVTHSVSANYVYRYYTQGAAYFYRSEYATTNGIDGYLSGDYRMNHLASHMFGASLHMDMDALADAHPFLGRTALWLNYERYFNSNSYSANILATGLDFHFQ